MLEKIIPQKPVDETMENKNMPVQRQIIFHRNSLNDIASHDPTMYGKNSSLVQPLPMYPEPLKERVQNITSKSIGMLNQPLPMTSYPVPLASSLGVTYLSPSKPGDVPISTPFETPSLTQKPLCVKRSSPRSDGETDRSGDEDEFVDVVNDLSRSTDGSKTDVSMSTQSCSSDSSPSNGSNTGSSPGSNGATPESTDGTKKKVRTNYAPDQVQALEKVFHENPYPDPEVMEGLSRDINIPEGKIKVWFQNKRARWRRRVQGNAIGYQPPFMTTMSPMLPPMPPYGYIPGSPLIGRTSSPVVPGHFMPYPQQSSPSSPNGTKDRSQSPSPMTSPFQPRQQMPPTYFYTYPYGMYPPYFCG